MDKIKILTAFGTRPEAIKMCPLILEMQKHNEIECVVCVTGQHRQMLNQVMDIFNIKPDFNLDIMRDKQTLTTITSDVLLGMEEIFSKVKPDIVLVHGDTSTSFVVALSAFYHQIPVGHVEAGLRTFDKYSPFPEEMNRSLSGKIATLHFAPTSLNKENLAKENITENVFITGNTILDSFKTTVRKDYEFQNEMLKKVCSNNKKIITVTAHRRENLGQPLLNICNAIKKLALKYKDFQVVYPVHLNPLVRETVFSVLGEMENVSLIEPIDVCDMHNLLSKSFLILTDSGGLQEEAPSFHVPVLVLRTETERTEAVSAKTVKVVGVEEMNIFNEADMLLNNKLAYNEMASGINPYGDGCASEKIISCIKSWFYGKNRG